MPKGDSAQAIVEQLEKIRGNKLNEEQTAEIELWQKGRALAQVASVYGFDIIREMLQSYVTDAVKRLVATDPAQKDEVLAWHAAAFAADRIYHNFLEDVQRAINTASSTPELVKQGLRQISPVPPESL